MSIHKSYRKMCPDRIVDDFVTNVIKTVPLRPGYNTVRVTLKSEKALGFCALTTLSAVCRKGCLVDIVDVVVKSAPRNQKLREVVPVNALFRREAYFYNTALVELQSESERFVEVETLLAAATEEGDEAIVLLNKGEKWVGELTEEHVGAVLRELGRFHALCLARPKKLEEFREELRGGYLTTLENSNTLKIIHQNVEAVIGFLEEAVAAKLRKFVGEVDDFLGNVLNGSGDLQVLVHGDLTTNFLFSHEKPPTSNTVSRAKLLNWQLVKLGSPVLDLAVFLFTNCSYDDLNNLHTFLTVYHNSLKQSLVELQCDVEDVFSYHRLEEEWRRFAKFGLALAFFNFKILSLGTSKRPNANEDETVEEFLQCFTTPPNEEFVRKIKELVKYCADSDLI